MKKLVSIILCIGILCSFLSISATGTMTEYSLLDGCVRLLGRGETLIDGNRTFNWPNAGFEFKFRGTSAEVNLAVNGTVYVNVQVDGGEPVRTRVLSGWFTLCDGLTAGEHTVRFVRSSEAHHGTMKAEFMRADAIPMPTAELAKKIEFIGDSYTTGYANISETPKSDYEAAVDTDNWYSYDAYIARMIDDYDVTTGTYDEDFGADFNVIAHHGKSLYVNGYEENSPFDYTVPNLHQYEDVFLSWNGNVRLVNMSTRTSWDYLKYQPQLVVIWLGTNDIPGTKFATAAGVKNVPKAFEDTYVDFLEKIRSVYPNATVLCMTRPNNACYGAEVKAAVEKMGGDSKKIHFLELTSFSASSVSHPNKTEAEGIAKQIVEKIMEIDESSDIWSVEGAEVVDITDMGAYDTNTGVFTFNDYDAYIKNNSNVIIYKGEDIAIQGYVAFYSDGKFLAPPKFLEVLEWLKLGDFGTMKIVADYNTRTIEASGWVPATNSKVAMLASDASKNKIIALGEVESDYNGDYTITMPVKDEYIGGEYIFHINYVGGKENNPISSEFTFKNTIPTMLVEDKNGDELKYMEQLSVGDKIYVTLRGFDFTDEFKGIVTIAQYDGNDALVDVKMLDANGGSVIVGSEIKKNVEVLNGIKKIKVMYWNRINLSPVFGEYTIN